MDNWLKSRWEAKRLAPYVDIVGTEWVTEQYETVSFKHTKRGKYESREMLKLECGHLADMKPRQPKKTYCIKCGEKLAGQIDD